MVLFPSPALFLHLLWCLWASLEAQMINNLPTVQETWVRSLGREDPLEKGMALHSSILAWRIPWTEEPLSCRGGCSRTTAFLGWTESAQSGFSLLLLQQNPLPFHRLCLGNNSGGSGASAWPELKAEALK